MKLLLLLTITLAAAAINTAAAATPAHEGEELGVCGGPFDERKSCLSGSLIDEREKCENA